MHRKNILWVAIAFLCASPAHAGKELDVSKGAILEQRDFTPIDPNTLKWTLAGEKDGITVETAEPKGSEVFAYRARAIVDAEMVKVATVLIDLSRMTEWMPQLGSIRVIKDLTPNQHIEYLHIQTPVVIKDRDFVLQVRADYDHPSKTAKISFKSVDYPDAPKTEYIRAKLFSSYYILKPLDGGKTSLELFIHVDPMGSVPKWVVNLFQRGQPRNTIRGIRRQAQKEDLIPLPGLKEIFEGKRSISDGLIKDAPKA